MGPTLDFSESKQLENTDSDFSENNSEFRSPPEQANFH